MRSIETLMAEGRAPAKAEKDKGPARVSLKGAEDVGPEILAQAIVDVSEAAKKLLAGPLTERAIVILIQDSCGHTAGGSKAVSQESIKLVLHAAADLRHRYVK
jgi:hypothetical protein